MCGTKLKNGRVLVLCPVVSHDVVSCRVAHVRCVVSSMCELALTGSLLSAKRAVTNYKSVVKGLECMTING